MEENKLKEVCSYNSFYISLQDQKNALGHTLQARQDLSKEETTRVHFAIHCHQHWAAVHLSISPFDLRAFPGQKFFRSSFCYTWCCETARTTNSSSTVIGAVQNIYDHYFKSSPWEFSSQYCRSSGPPTLERCLNESTCARKTESALLNNIRNDLVVDECPLTIFDLDDADDFPARRLKRRRLGAARESNRHDNDDQGDISGDEETDGTGDGDTMETQSVTPSIEEVSVQTISDKIRKALHKMSSGEKQKRGRVSQFTAQARKVKSDASRDQPSSTDAILSQFKDRFARGEFPTKDRFLCLENILWEQSSRVLQGAQEIAWKGSFAAACVRKIRHCTPSHSGDAGASQSTVTRWTIAAWMINLIVDGLWSTWGPKAALVYEALASKNYSLSRIVKFSEQTLRSVIHGVVNNLKEFVPLVSCETYVFHPAACISSALDIGYERTCLDLGLESSFSKLDPPQSLQSHALLSWLSDQWANYLTTLPLPCEPVTGPVRYSRQGDSTSSSLDALTAVAQSILATGHLHDSMEQSCQVNVPTFNSSAERFPVEDGDEERSLCQSTQQRGSQPNAYDLQQTAGHSNLSALHTPDLDQASTGNAIASSTLHLWDADDLLNRPHLYESIQFENPLHLWNADDLLNRPYLYEPIQFENPLHLWEADDLVNHPQLYEPLDLDWFDGGGDQIDVVLGQEENPAAAQ